jgi:hypothetical protein
MTLRRMGCLAWERIRLAQGKTNGVILVLLRFATASANGSSTIFTRHAVYKMDGVTNGRALISKMSSCRIVENSDAVFALRRISYISSSLSRPAIYTIVLPQRGRLMILMDPTS